MYCAEVEGALYELPGVSEAIVFGLPHERLGEEVAAVIVAALALPSKPKVCAPSFANPWPTLRCPPNCFSRRTRCLATPRGNSSRGTSGRPCWRRERWAREGTPWRAWARPRPRGALAASLSGCDGGAASGDRAAPYPLPPNLWPRAIVAIASNVIALASLGPRPWAMWWPGRRGKRRGCRRCLLGSRRGFPRPCRPGGLLAL